MTPQSPLSSKKGKKSIQRTLKDTKTSKAKSIRISWDADKKESLVKMLSKYSMKPGKKGWTTETWQKVTNEMKNKYGPDINTDKLQQLLKDIKRKYKRVVKILEIDGFKWNGEYSIIKASDYCWQNHLEGNPKDEVWRGKKIPFFQFLDDLYKDDAAKKPEPEVAPGGNGCNAEPNSSLQPPPGTTIGTDSYNQPQLPFDNLGGNGFNAQLNSSRQPPPGTTIGTDPYNQPQLPFDNLGGNGFNAQPNSCHQPLGTIAGTDPYNQTQFPCYNLGGNGFNAQTNSSLQLPDTIAGMDPYNQTLLTFYNLGRNGFNAQTNSSLQLPGTIAGTDPYNQTQLPSYNLGRNGFIAQTNSSLQLRGTIAGTDPYNQTQLPSYNLGGNGFNAQTNSSLQTPPATTAETNPYNQPQLSFSNPGVLDNTNDNHNQLMAQSCSNVNQKFPSLLFKNEESINKEFFDTHPTNSPPGGAFQNRTQPTQNPVMMKPAAAAGCTMTQEYGMGGAIRNMQFPNSLQDVSENEQRTNNNTTSNNKYLQPNATPMLNQMLVNGECVTPSSPNKENINSGNERNAQMELTLTLSSSPVRSSSPHIGEHNGNSSHRDEKARVGVGRQHDDQYSMANCIHMYNAHKELKAIANAHNIFLILKEQQSREAFVSFTMAQKVKWIRGEMRRLRLVKSDLD